MILYNCSNYTISVPDSEYQPLEIKSSGGEKTELERFREAAKTGTPREELIGLTGVDTGLRRTSIAHMNKSWLDDTGDQLTIDVPRKQRCELGTGSEGRGGDTTAAGKPCYHCKHRNVNKDWLPAAHKLPDGGDCWRPKSKAGYKGREIPIKNEDTEQILRSYFALNETICGKSGVQNAVIRIAERADLLEVWTDESGDKHRWPTTHNLRHTFGTMLAIKGFSGRQIQAAMGHESVDVADDYVKFSGRETVGAFDEHWNE
jgi:integrase/recombinase XerD